MAYKTGMQENLCMLETEDNKKVSEIGHDSEVSKKCVNITDSFHYGNGFRSIWTDMPLESKYIEHESRNAKKNKSANIADCVEDENRLLSNWVDLTIVDGGESLLTISLAVVHLVDGEWSVELGRGEFSIIQGSTYLPTVAKIGENLHWPISEDVRAFKLDNLRYLFLILTPDVEAFDDVEDIAILSDVPPAEELNYVVSFQLKNESPSLDLLDKLLEQHAQFTDSSLVDKGFSLPKPKDKGYNSGLAKAIAACTGKQFTDSSLVDKGFSLPKPDPNPNPNPKDKGYKSGLAKAIAAGTGKVVEGLFFCSGAYSSHLQKGGKLLMDRMEANATKSSEINPRFIKNIQRVKKLSKATENISENALKGIQDLAVRVVRISGKKCKSGNTFFNTLPGEMLLVSWNSFNKIVGAVEEAGKDALISTSEVATDIVKHRFGEDVGEVAHDTLAVAGHTVATAMNIAKIRNFLNPASHGVKSLGKVIEKVVIESKC